MSNILFFDTETTGLDPESNSVIQIAAQYYQDGIKTADFEAKVRPYTDAVGLGALATNKTTPTLMNNYPETKVSCDKFVEFVTGLPGFNFRDKIIPGAHNASFDIGFMKNLLAHCGYSGWDEIFSYRVVDTAAIARFLIDAGALNCKSASLGTIAQALNIHVDKDKQHEAMYDTELCARSYFAMRDLVKGQLNLEPRQHNWA